MIQHKIVPSIWFNADNGELSKVLSYYSFIFADAFKSGSIMPLNDTPSGRTELCEVNIFGAKYSFMNTAQPHHPLNDAVSFSLFCEDQTEIDHFWDYFTTEGKASQCGWCIDKYGLRWQVLPKNLGELMQKPNAFSVMMKQQKIVISEYLTQ